MVLSGALKPVDFLAPAVFDLWQQFESCIIAARRNVSAAVLDNEQPAHSSNRHKSATADDLGNVCHASLSG
jgi:hypothetical protein